MLTTPIDIEQSYQTFDTFAGYTQDHAGLHVWKAADDMRRYRAVIEATRPDTLIETGTRWGGFAAWVADEFGLRVITIDAFGTPGRPTEWPGVEFVRGDSTSSLVVELVAGMVDGGRVMVSLDSDHHAPHVRAEIAAYAPLVSPGCYLVVEDGLADLVSPERARRFGSGIPEGGGPLAAIRGLLVGDPRWERDLEIEALTPVSHHPAGWWRRV